MMADGRRDVVVVKRYRLGRRSGCLVLPPSITFSHEHSMCSKVLQTQKRPGYGGM